jgi:hypothetical protein
LILSSKATASGHIKVVKELLHHNADIESKLRNGMTSLILGKFQNHFCTLETKKKTKKMVKISF